MNAKSLWSTQCKAHAKKSYFIWHQKDDIQNIYKFNLLVSFSRLIINPHFPFFLSLPNLDMLSLPTHVPLSTTFSRYPQHHGHMLTSSSVTRHCENKVPTQWVGLTERLINLCYTWSLWTVSLDRSDWTAPDYPQSSNQSNSRDLRPGC